MSYITEQALRNELALDRADALTARTDTILDYLSAVLAGADEDAGLEALLADEA